MYLSFVLLYFDFWTILVHWSFDDSSALICHLVTQTTSGPPVVTGVYVCRLSVAEDCVILRGCGAVQW